MKILTRLKRVRIAIRLAIMIGVIMVAAIGLIAYWAFNNMNDISLERARSDTTNLVQSIERSVVISMFGKHAGDIDHLNELVAEALEPFSQREDIHSVLVASHGGRVMFSSDPTILAGSTLPKDMHPACIQCHENDKSQGPSSFRPIDTVFNPSQNMVRASGAIFNTTGCSSAACHAHKPSQQVLGVITVEQDLERVSDSLDLARRRIILVTVLMALAGPLLVLVLLRNWLDRPVRTLLNGIHRVAEGRLDEVIPMAEGELGEVAHSFNMMQQRLAESQKQLVRSEKMASLGKIAAGVAHEINNPLTGILTYTEELVEEADTKDPLLEDYKVILRETLRCREIVRNLLDFARRGQAQKLPIDINNVIHHTVDLVSRLAVFRNVELFTDLHDDLPAIYGDESQLQQVFLNFMVNSAEAMEGGGTIRITSLLQRDGLGAVIVFSDKGPGIPAVILDHIFEPFFSTKKGKSTGLGLSVSWGIIEEHGGRIEVVSGKEKGTTFRVYLPAAPPSGKQRR